MLLQNPDSVDPVELEARTGWALRPEGLCLADRCVPTDGALLTATMLDERLGMPLVTDDATGLSAIGPPTLSGRALDSVEVPDIELMDFEGRVVRLADVLGPRTVVVSWAPW